ncbi:LacI family DNA-binding transcriptional regulator [uncultured Jannaschia sp.]|uniref:LacI family DNA-binding transcriptional regulator n=1 Tax=uncultured Jannaschia sp. TaxID=293347 RepID=UPI00261A131E|nr:LacI family DNA-binding transcriptional regulator [uncultured Jannaschia sp.]
MHDVGRIAGVSQVTVSRALSDPSKVSPETLTKVMGAVEATGFVPNAIAGALASRKSRLVSALVPSITNVVYSSMVRAFSERLRAYGYQILLSETGFAPEAEEATVVAHLSRRPDAIMLTGIQHTPQVRRLLLAAGIPVVELWDVSDSPIDLCVGFHHVDAARAAAEFARDRGYRVAATVTAADERACRRRTGFAERFARDTGNPVPDFDTGGAASIAAGRQGLAGLIDRHGIGGGLVYCSSDIIAHGVMIEAQSRGLRIPDDLAVIGFGDQEFARHLEPALTTVRIDLAQLGQSAADAVLSRLDGQTPPSPVIDLGFEIVARASA